MQLAQAEGVAGTSEGLDAGFRDALESLVKVFELKGQGAASVEVKPLLRMACDLGVLLLDRLAQGIYV
jgi:hypothetical protein